MSGPGPSGPAAAAPSTGGVGRWLRAQASYALLQAAFLAVLLGVSPRFFWVDDQQGQFLPVLAAHGRLLARGAVPLLDVGSGAAGNHLADPQTGVLDPLHWVLSVLVSRVDDLAVAAAVLGVGAVLLLGAGVVAVGLRAGAPTGLAVATAVGTASTGFSLWWGSSWWPSMLGFALLPWLWLGLTSTGRLGVLLVGLSSWALAGSGHPYSLVLAAVLVVAHHVEVVRAGGGAALLGRRVLARLLAGLAGLVGGAPALVGALEMAPATSRSVPETAAGNLGERIPNALDVVLGGVTLSPVVTGDIFDTGSVLIPPLAATFVLAVPALALVDWRRAAASPGVPTALALALAAVVLTQAPTYVGTFRFPYRYLAAVAIWVALLALVALAAAPAPGRRRLRVAAGLVGAQVVLALLRAPAGWPWHLAAGAAGLLGLLVLVVVLRAGAGARAVPPRPRRGQAVRRRLVAGGLLALVGLAGPLLGLANTWSLGEDRQRLAGEGPVELWRQLLTFPEWSTDVADLRRQAVAPDQVVTLPRYAVGPEQGWAWGVFTANAGLSVGQRTGFGYSAASHEAWASRWCSNQRGAPTGSQDCVEGLLATAPGTDAAWLDVVSSDVLVLQPETPEALRAHVEQSPRWEAAGERGRDAVFRRADDLPGRVTWAPPGARVVPVTGTRTDPGGADAVEQDVAVLGEPFATFSASTGAQPAEVVLAVPAWPGLTATAAGAAVPVGSLEGTATTVVLPAGLEDAVVEVSFEPLAARAFWPCVGAALAGLVAAALTHGGSLPTRRRSHDDTVGREHAPAADDGLR